MILQSKMCQFLYSQRILEQLCVLQIAILQLNVSKSVLLFDFALVHNRTTQAHNSHLHLLRQVDPSHQLFCIVHAQVKCVIGLPKVLAQLVSEQVQILLTLQQFILVELLLLKLIWVQIFTIQRCGLF